MGVMLRDGMKKSMNTDKFFAPTMSMDEYTLNFNFNELNLTEEKNAEKLNSLIQWLQINPSANISLEAYTHDGEKKSVGSERYEAVLAALKTAGISETRIIGTMNKAFQVKKVKADTDELKASSRKVTFAIVKK
jgi:outer membrane protein OmpA-like peptidoglycan-associated protein